MFPRRRGMGVERLSQYLDFHIESMKAGDVDPQNACLRYISERFELNLEQRYWLAYLFGTCYCAPTVFYMYNEFPDYEKTDPARLRNWWAKNKKHCYFQTDRRRFKNNDDLVPSFLSFKKLIGENNTQHDFFWGRQDLDMKRTFKTLFRDCQKIFSFGRFSLFNYLDMVRILTPCRIEPPTIEFQHARSCRNGLKYILGEDEAVDHGKKTKWKRSDQVWLHDSLMEVTEAVELATGQAVSLFAIETTLCSFKKLILGKRYPGYYIERMKKELEMSEREVVTGVDWSVLWDFRKETYNPEFLTERT